MGEILWGVFGPVIKIALFAIALGVIWWLFKAFIASPLAFIGFAVFGFIAYVIGAFLYEL